MGWGRGMGIAGALVATSLTMASTAGAATEVGNDCLANGSASDFTLLQLQRSSGATLPIAAPAAGVVTRWTVKSGLSSVLAENLRVFRPTGNPNEFRVIADSATEPIVPGTNVFRTRIRVLAGDRFGAYAGSPSGALYCSPTGATDVMGAVHFNAGVGLTQPYAPNPDYQVALSATVEPDADSDGYGDETQDRCPKGARYQGPCPHVTLTVSATARKRSIQVQVKTSSEARVHVFGQVSWQVRDKPGEARSSRKAKTHGLIVGLTSGTQEVDRGELARFNVKLPRPVLRRLGRLTQRESLRVTITARGTDLAGRIKDKRIKVRLRGRAKAQP